MMGTVLMMMAIVWQKRLVVHVLNTSSAVPNYAPPPHPPFLQGGWWGGFASPNSLLLLTMGLERSDRKVNSALVAMYPLLMYLPVRESPSSKYLSVGLR